MQCSEHRATLENSLILVSAWQFFFAFTPHPQLEAVNGFSLSCQNLSCLGNAGSGESVQAGTPLHAQEVGVGNEQTLAVGPGLQV